MSCCNDLGDSISSVGSRWSVFLLRMWRGMVNTSVDLGGDKL